MSNTRFVVADVTLNDRWRIFDTEDGNRVVTGKRHRAAAEKEARELNNHDCMEHAQPCTTTGPLGHGWECGRCGAFLQAG